MLQFMWELGAAAGTVALLIAWNWQKVGHLFQKPHLWFIVGIAMCLMFLLLALGHGVAAISFTLSKILAVVVTHQWPVVGPTFQVLGSVVVIVLVQARMFMPCFVLLTKKAA